MAETPYTQDILELGEKWIAGTITPEERTRLMVWYDRFDDSELTLEEGQAARFHRLKEEMLRDIHRQLRPERKVRPLTRYSIAAAAVLLLAFGVWYYAARGKTAPGLPGGAPLRASLGDIGPGVNKAVLTLSDGSTVALDSSGAGNLGRQGNARVVKPASGQLQYTATGESTGTPVVYNTLTTPRGGQYRLKLQDGTNVWLDAGSSIRYPTAFTGRERRVEVTGEAYFEVAKNSAAPFRVTVTDPATGAPATEIEVLGTEFNINAYKDEADLRTTLVSGSVRVVRGASSVVLEPAQQAVVTTAPVIRTVAANVEQTVAWKEGAFAFDDADIPAIMRQVSRWYDLDIEYDGPPPANRFTGRFSRNTSLAGVLKILHLSGVQLSAENKKIVIKS